MLHTRLRVNGDADRPRCGETEIMPMAMLLGGYLICYVLFLVGPVFLSAADKMQFLTYVPVIQPVGIDLHQMIRYSAEWWIFSGSPYVGANPYPPFTAICFVPLLFVNPSTAYLLVTIVNVLTLLLLVAATPLFVAGSQRVFPYVVFFMITAVSSYGFHFELERGQFNLLATLICFTSICLLYTRRPREFTACILFTVAVQIKTFPIFYAAMLVDGSKGLRGNLRRLAIVGTMNVAFLLVLGPAVLRDFLGAIVDQATNPHIWTGNHSIVAFQSLLLGRGFALMGLEGSAIRGEAISAALFVVVAICVLVTAHSAWRSRAKGLDPFLLVTCTIAALLIPPVSHDYKLPILAAPLVLLFSRLCPSTRYPPGSQGCAWILCFIVSLAYSLTLFSYAGKPTWLANNCPTLLVMLLAVTGLSVLQWPGKRAT